MCGGKRGKMEVAQGCEPEHTPEYTPTAGGCEREDGSEMSRGGGEKIKEEPIIDRERVNLKTTSKVRASRRRK